MPSSDHTSAPDSLALAIVNARIQTGDAWRPWADALLVRGALIEAVGGSAEVRKRAGDAARVIDAKGMTLLPESTGGILAPGLRADMVLVEGNTSSLSVGSLAEAKIVLSLVNGRVIVDRDGLVK